jgi:hypothetical protein
MATVLIPEPLVLAADRSVIAPLTISGLPGRVQALDLRWQRKSEFHLTAIAAQRAARAPRSSAGSHHAVLDRPRSGHRHRQ